MLDGCRFTHNLACKGTPALFLAANFLEPDDKFRAFQATFGAMRLVETAANGQDQEKALSAADKQQVIAELDHFAAMFRNGHIDDSLPHAQDLKLALARFEIPHRPFTLLAEGMKFDLDNDRFDTLDQFLNYAEGVVVAPASVFMHVAASVFDDRGQLIRPVFNIFEAARPLALFAYLAHIMRDFKKDFLAGITPHIYIDTHTSDTFFVHEEDMAVAVSTGEQSLKFTKMIKWYFNRMTEFQHRADDMLTNITPLLPPDGRFALHFIFELYTATAKKIADHDYIVVHDDLTLTPNDLLEVAGHTADRLGYDAAPITGRLKSLLDKRTASPARS